LKITHPIAPAPAIDISITSSAAGTRPRRNFSSQAMAGARISESVTANASGIRISRARYSTATTLTRMAMFRMPEETGDLDCLIMGERSN